MLEDTESPEGQEQISTDVATPETAEELAGAETDATKPVSEDGQGEATKTPLNLDEEVVIELADGKSFTMKRGQAIELFEKQNVLSEKEKSILEKEKSLNRDYTQKSQANAQFRKEFESTFGRFPAQEEMKALGKIWNAYFKDPEAKQLIDRILTGQHVNQDDGSGKAKVDPYVRSLEAKIAQLEEKWGGLSTSIEEKEQAAITAENNRIFSTWAKGKDAQGIKITQEVDMSMAPFVRAIRQAQPEWTPEKVLDEAYKHATIDQLKSDVTKQTLVSADKAKKAGMIRITPKGGQAQDASKSYKQMLMEAA